VTVLAEYSRSTVRSNIEFLVPGTLTRELYLYRDNAHTGTSLVDIALPGSGAVQPRISLGGSFFVSSGSRPTRYHQPMARFALPLTKNVQWGAEWRWYGMSQPLFQFEGFRSNQFITNIRLTM
jgi:hypothetical protein